MLGCRFVARNWFDRNSANSQKTATVAVSERSSKKNNPFAHMKHYVFSNTLDSVDDEFVLVKGDVKKQVEAIRKEPGNDIAVFGGAHLACSLINLALVDEVMVAICPVLLGGGKPFFAGIDKKIQLTLSDSKVYASGLVVLTYNIASKR